MYKRPVKATDEGVSSPRLPLDATDRSQNVWQWILESERQGKHKPHRYVSDHNICITEYQRITFPALLTYLHFFILTALKA